MKKISLILLISFLSGCNEPPNVFICIELDVNKAYCSYTVKGDSYYWDDTNKLNGETYWESKTHLLRVPIESWGEIKKYIVKNCKKYGNCSEAESLIGNVDRNLKLD